MGAGDHPDREIRGGGGDGAISKNLFSALQASVWSKIKGRGPPPRAPPLDPPLAFAMQLPLPLKQCNSCRKDIVCNPAVPCKGLFILHGVGGPQIGEVTRLDTVTRLFI